MVRWLVPTLLVAIRLIAPAQAVKLAQPPGEETSEIKALIDRAAAQLESGASDASAILSDAGYLPAHAWPRFRALIRKLARPVLTMVTSDEPGERLTVTGVVRDAGGQPVKDAEIYVYHTNAKGWYSDQAPHISGVAGDEKHARLFGWLRTGADGRYDLHTIQPAGYPGSDLPAHIHVELFRGEKSLVTEIRFEDDPRLTREQRERSAKERFLVVSVRREGAARSVTADLGMP